MIDFWKRVKKYLTGDMTQAWLSSEIGVTPNVLSGWIQRGAEPKATKAQAIASALGVTVEYLVTGSDPYQESTYKYTAAVNKLAKEFPEPMEVHSTNGVPYYETDVLAHVTSSFNDDLSMEPSFFINFRPFNDCTALIPVRGDSMVPLFYSGDIIAIKEIHNINVIQWGEPHVVICGKASNDMRVLKFIYQHKDNDKIILRSKNPDYAGDTIINKQDILSMYIVKGKIQLSQY